MARLNVQGLARKDKRLMSALKAPPGFSYVSCDLSAGEPTVTTHFSQDKNYYDATFGMVGKAPYYAGEILKIDNIYLNVASVSPIGKSKVRELYHTTWNGETFADRWLRDADLIKDEIKPLYALHKILALGLSYSMGPRKLVAQAYDAGHTLPFKVSKDFYDKYWTLYGDVYKLGKLLEAKYKRDGFLVNPFGYRLKPDKEYKALNYFIQSSVSGIMHILCAKFFALCSWARFVTIIHDELVMLVPTSRLAEAEACMRLVEESLNADLKWRVKIRVGWKPGTNMYEAK